MSDEERDRYSRPARDDRPVPRPQTEAQVGEENILIEIVTALILRGQTDSIVIPRSELVRVYDLLANRYALIAYQDQQTLDIRVTLTGPESIPLMYDVIDRINQGERRSDAVPDVYKPHRQRKDRP